MRAPPVRERNFRAAFIALIYLIRHAPRMRGTQ